MIDNMNGKAINKIHNLKALNLDKPLYEVIVKKEGEVIFHNKGYAGIVNLVQSVTLIDPVKDEMEGDSQVIGFGHPLIMLFAFDQMRKKLHEVFLAAATMYTQMKKFLKKEDLTKQLDEIAKHMSFSEKPITKKSKK